MLKSGQFFTGMIVAYINLYLHARYGEKGGVIGQLLIGGVSKSSLYNYFIALIVLLTKFLKGGKY